jgi:hypothetical protein
MNEQKPPSFAVGDRVKLITAPPGFPLGNIGSAGRVMAVTGQGYTVKFESVYKATVPGIPESCLVRWDDA